MAVNTTGIKNMRFNYKQVSYVKKLYILLRMFYQRMVSLYQKFLWEVLLMKLSHYGKKIFKEVKVFKPKSSRKDSKESFIICKNLR